MIDRREKASRISRIVSQRIGEVTTRGLGRWGPAWDFVAEPSDAFLDALDRWETEGSPDGLEDVQSRAEAFVAAWRDADQQYQIAGRPDKRETVPA